MLMRVQPWCMILVLGSCVPMQGAPVGAGGPGQREIVADGPFVHASSGAVFPMALGGCPRGSILAYSAGEDDVGASYQSLRPDARLMTTVYVYPRSLRPPRDLKRHLAEVVREVQQYHAGAKVGEIQDFTLDLAQAPGMGATVSFAYETRIGLQNELAESRAILFESGDWFIKFRMTYPKAEHEAVEAMISKTLRDFGWPAKAQQSAGSSGGTRR